jgi:hypothetical protein
MSLQPIDKQGEIVLNIRQQIRIELHRLYDEINKVQAELLGEST